VWSSGLEWSSPRCEGYSSCLRKTIRPLGETLLSDWQKSLAYIGPSSRPREMAVVGPPETGASAITATMGPITERIFPNQPFRWRTSSPSSPTNILWPYKCLHRIFKESDALKQQRQG